MLPAQEFERAGIGRLRGGFVVDRPRIVGETVACLIDMALRRRKGLEHLRDDLRRRVGIGLGEMEQQRALRLQAQIRRQSRAVEGDGAA